MTKSQIEEFVKKTILDYISDDYDPKQKMDQMEIDALDCVEIIMTVEEEYNITITEAESDHIETPNDLIKIIIQKIVASGREVKED